MGIIASGKKALKRKAIGRMINLFNRDPLVIFNKTGNSLDAAKPEAF